MSWELIIAAIVFLITYALISVKNLTRFEISMPVAALIGAILMLILGIVSVTDAVNSLNFDVLLLLLGMMMLVSALDACGFFGCVAHILIKRCSSGTSLLATVMLLSAFLSALVLNDAVVLLLTPVVIRCCKSMHADPIPYLVGVFISANIGSVATVIGNPQNAYIATTAGIDFVTFSVKLLPMTVISLVIAFTILWVAFRKKLSIEKTELLSENVIDKLRLIILLILTSAMIILFTLSHSINISLATIAIIGGCIAILIVSTKGLKTIKGCVKRIDWGVLLFFIGLFVVMAGVVSSGLLDYIVSLIPGLSPGNPSVLGITVLSTIISNLISNVPAVLLIRELIPIGDTTLWLTLAASSTLAGNMTLIGAAANVIVCEESEKEGIKLDFWKFLKVGVPISILTLVVMFFFMIL